MSKNCSRVAGHVLPILVLMWLAGCTGGDSSNDPVPGGGATNGAPGGVGTNYAVGGTVTGLLGTVVLQNNGGNDLTLSANSAFAFATTVATGSNYNVTALTQPASQTCTVANGAGTVSGANVADVSVTCSSSFASSSLALLAGDLGGSGNADGVGAAARFDEPHGAATDSAGNVYVADSRNSTIRKTTPAGVVTTFAGTAGVSGSADGTGAAARFSFPQGVATDSAGNVYVGDSGTIRKITPGGVVTTLAGAADLGGSADGAGAAARFNGPQGVATDSAGNVYVADTGNFTIRKITPAGVVTTLAGTAPGDNGGGGGSADGTGPAAYFSYPTGVATDSAGNVYVADNGGSTIRKVTPAGVVTTLAGTAGLRGGTDGTGAAARFHGPFGVATDSAGNVYVTDIFNHTLRKVTPTGEVSTIAGVAGQAGFAPGALPGLLDRPLAVAVSGTSLYVTLDNGVAVVQNRP